MYQCATCDAQAWNPFNGQLCDNCWDNVNDVRKYAEKSENPDVRKKAETLDALLGHLS